MNWKSKKTLRIEAATYEQLWQEAEDALEKAHAANRRLRADFERIDRPKFVVLAKTLRRGTEAMQNLRLNPSGLNALYITPGNPQKLRGLRLEANTHIVYSEGWDSGVDGQRLRDQWQQLLLCNTQWERQRFVCDSI